MYIYIYIYTSITYHVDMTSYDYSVLFCQVPFSRFFYPVLWAAPKVGRSPRCQVTRETTQWSVKKNLHVWIPHGKFWNPTRKNQDQTNKTKHDTRCYNQYSKLANMFFVGQSKVRICIHIYSDIADATDMTKNDQKSWATAATVHWICMESLS